MKSEVAMRMERRQFVALFGSLAAAATTGSLRADEPKLAEPVHRVAANVAADRKANPLDRALAMAEDALEHCRANIDDYTALLVKRERIDGTLSPHQYMFAKIRNRKMADGKLAQPLSVYLNFLKPSNVKGREVLYVENQNDGQIVAHEGGFKGRFLPTVTIPPDGMLAMRGQRYPMTEIGIENLILKLIERGETARKYSDVTCEFRKNARVKDRACTVLQVTQPTRRPELVFYKAQIFLDEQLNLPIRYVAYDWPKNEGDALQVIEEYNYLDVKTNVGLTASDFDPYNDDYNFYS